MKLQCFVYTKICLSLLLVTASVAQNQGNAAAAGAATASTQVPRLVKFGGTVKDVQGKPITGVVGITFALYKDEEGGAPLWLETQNVQSDAKGHYTVMLGSTKSEGLPLELFSSNEARWVGIQVQGQNEQPRVLLVSAPYALKAADAETLGGKPISAFQLAVPRSNNGSTQGQPQLLGASEQANEITCSGSAACKAGFIPVFSSNGGSASVNDSIITQSGTTIGIAGQVVGQTGAFQGSNSGAIFQARQNHSTNGAAVAGFAGGTSGVGVQGAGTTGLFGQSLSPTGIGTLSQGIGQSRTASSFIGCCPVGIWGDTNQSGNGATGVIATADDAKAIFARNNSPTGFPTAFFTNTQTTNHGLGVWVAQGAFGQCSSDTDGDLTCTGRVKGNNLVKTVTANNLIFSQCSGGSRCPFSTMPNMSIPVNTGNVPVLILGQVGGILMVDCSVINIDLFVDGRSVDHQGIQYGQTEGGNFTRASTTLVSIQSGLAPGNHTIEIDWNTDATGCGNFATNSASDFDSTRSLTVVELAGTQQQ